MKILCDVCNREEASLFCCADEAALCEGCDRRVHYANKLASKHHRFSLIHSTCKEAPVCDVCQERRAFLFCQEDRAILCRECDLPIHTANDLTKRHNRFLLTGVKLSSPTSAASSSSSYSCTSSASSAGVDHKTEIHAALMMADTTKFVPCEVDPATGKSEEVCTSSISDYLTKTLPGWHVEDLLDSSALDGLCKTDDLFSFLDTDFDPNFNLISEDLPIGVPQVPQIAAINSQTGIKNFKDSSNLKIKTRWTDDVWAVPQISPPPKRSRPFWYAG